MQRVPSPNTIGEARIVLPWSRIALAVGSWPEEFIVTVSGLTVPLATSSAPPVAAELSQPRPGAPKFAQGQATPAGEPSPAQNGLNVFVSSTSWNPLTEPEVPPEPEQF